MTFNNQSESVRLKPENPSKQDRTALLTPKQVAGLLNVSCVSLQRDRSERRGLPYIKLGNNTVRYIRGEVLDYIQQHRVEVRQ